MEQLLKSTAAYKILCGDAASGKLSHSYMLYFADEENLRSALKIFARQYFPTDRQTLIEDECLTDLKIYPSADKKLTAEAASQIVADGAIKPVLHDKKLFIISGFNEASPVFQNKLLKILEEPPVGVYFLLGVTSTASVLTTVTSRVKLLEIPPFSQEQVLAALQRQGENPKNAAAAQSSGGILGVAQSLLKGDRYEEINSAAREMVSAVTLSQATDAAVKYADFKYKKELLSEMQRLYFCEVKKYAQNPEYSASISVGAAIYAVERINEALEDIKFNANFPSLIYRLAMDISKRNVGKGKQ